MKKTLFVVLAVLCFCPSVWATTTITGNLKNLSGGSISLGTFVRFYLRGCSGNQPRINGTALIAPTLGNVYYVDFVPSAAGAISGTVYSTTDATGTGNGDIECGGLKTGVWYGMVPFLNGKSGPETPIAAKNTATIDISNVTPLTANPVVVSPTGDLTYARLDGGNMPFTGTIQGVGETLTGNLTAVAGTFSGDVATKSINKKLIVDQFPGATLDAKMAAAVTSCAPASFLGCTFYISGESTNNYTYSSTLVYPLVNGGSGNNALVCAEGVTLNYTGSGYAVEAAVTPGANQTNAANVIIRGCHINGSSAGLAGIHLKGFSVCRIYDVVISQFSNGDGIFNEGANTCQFYGAQLYQNRIGYHVKNVTNSDGEFNAAGNIFAGGHMQGNSVWGVWEDATNAVVSPGTFPGGNVYTSVIEGNGTAPTTKTATGAASGTLVTITPTTSNPFLIGMLMYQTGFNNGTCYNGHFTIESITATTYSYHCTGGAATSTGGTAVGHTGQLFIQGSTGTTIRSSFMQTGSATGMDAEVYFGDQTYQCIACGIRDVDMASGGVTNSIQDWFSSGTVVDGNNEGSVPTNFYNHGQNGGETNSYVGRNTSTATNYLGGFFNLVENDVVLTPTDGGVQATYFNLCGVLAVPCRLRQNSAFGQTTDIKFFDPGTTSAVVAYRNIGATSQKAETGSADANVLTVTPLAAVGTYRVCFTASVSSATSGVIGWTLSWTDSNGNAQSNIAQSLFQQGTAAPALTFTVSAAGNYQSCSQIDVNNAAANIVVKWVGGGTTAAKVSATLERLQ